MLTVTAFGQSSERTTDVVLTDVSKPNNILKFSGNISFREHRVGEKVTQYKHGSITLNSVSGKDIISFVTKFTMMAGCPTFRGFRNVGFSPLKIPGNPQPLTICRDKNVIDPWPKWIRTKQNPSEPHSWKPRKESSRVENFQNQSEPTW